MDRFVYALFLQDLNSPVSYDFIDVHIELGPTSRHPDRQREIAVQFSSKDVITGLYDGIGPFRRNDPQFLIGQSGGFFQIGQRPSTISVWDFSVPIRNFQNCAVSGLPTICRREP